MVKSISKIKSIRAREILTVVIIILFGLLFSISNAEDSKEVYLQKITISLDDEEHVLYERGISAPFTGDPESIWNKPRLEIDDDLGANIYLIAPEFHISSGTKCTIWITSYFGPPVEAAATRWIADFMSNFGPPGGFEKLSMVTKEGLFRDELVSFTMPDEAYVGQSHLSRSDDMGLHRKQFAYLWFALYPSPSPSPSPPPSSSYSIRFPNPLKCEDIPCIIEAIINFIFYVGVVLLPLMIIIGAIMLMTAAGDPERISTAKRLLFWAVIGLTIILFAKGIISFVEYILE